jgi:hypothetical protein
MKLWLLGRYLRQNGGSHEVPPGAVPTASREARPRALRWKSPEPGSRGDPLLACPSPGPAVDGAPARAACHGRAPG